MEKSDKDVTLSMENIDKILEDIENKYSSANISPKNDFEKQVHILSQAFETFGIPTLNLNESKKTCLQDIVSSSLLLVQLHRKTLSHIRDIKVCGKCQDSKNTHLENAALHLKRRIQTLEDNNSKLNTTIVKLESQCSGMKKKMEVQSGELRKIKYFYNSKQSQLNHHINNLKTENQHLKEICGRDIDKYYTKEEKFLKILNQHKQNEVMYKSSLKKLEENNEAIMNEILTLRHELTLAYNGT